MMDNTSIMWPIFTRMSAVPVIFKNCFNISVFWEYMS
jgi:hypothetical protein